jgi:hypothetical protein
MALVRILVAADYSPHEGRFKSSAFTESSIDHGISCFDRGCADIASGGPCRHIALYYPEKIPPGGGPVYFWEFDPSTIPAPQPPRKPDPNKPMKAHQIKQTRSDTGDDCHYDIFDLSDSVRQKFFKAGHHTKATGQFNNVFRCNGGQLEPITTIADMPELHRK